MPEKMILGAQMYTIRKFASNNEDLARSMEKIAKIGYKYVQLSGTGKDVTPDAIAKASKDTGLKVVLTHTDMQRIIDETDAVIEEHTLYGCDCIGIGGGYMFKPFNDESVKIITESLAPAIEKITAAGKTFAYHNHRFEYGTGADGKLFLDALLEKSPKMMLILDLYWVQSGGADPAVDIEKYADRIYTTHFKDMRIVENEQKYAEVLEGNMNYDRIVEACLKCGVKRHMVEQDDVLPGQDPFDCLETSYRNVMARYGQYFEQ